MEGDLFLTYMCLRRVGGDAAGLKSSIREHHAHCHAAGNYLYD